jgi:hypothetical protein
MAARFFLITKPQASHTLRLERFHLTLKTGITMPIAPRWFAISTCALCLALAAPLAQAAKPKASADAPAKSKPAARGKTSSRTTSADGLTPAQRKRSEDERLRRECKGRPNAGACLGYAN